MRRDQQLYCARVLQEQSQQLKGVVRDHSERETPLTAVEARLLVNTIDRLAEIAHAFRVDAAPHGWRRYAPKWLRQRAAQARGFTKPRIGRLRHYPPRPLALPAAYLRTLAPDPAPTISVVTPSFQQGRFLARTLESVVGQGYPALEYVVRDGISTDETIEVLRRFDSRVTHWASEPDAGQADAINRGFANTTGEIMGWLNSDDLLLPGSLAYIAGYFAAHPEVDVIYGDRLMVDELDGQIGAWILPPHDDLALTLADFIPQETLFWRRSIWETSGGHLDPEFRYALDWDLLLRFREAGATMVHLPRYLGAFRIHDGQKTSVDEPIGAEECARLRRRVHRRNVPIEEVVERLQPYYRRHVRAHIRRRLTERLPQRHVYVGTYRQENPEPAAPAGTGAVAEATSREYDSSPDPHR